MVMLTALIVAGLFAIIGLALLLMGQRSADQAHDPQSHVGISHSRGGDHQSLNCRVNVTNPGQMPAIVSMDVRWSSIFGPLFLGVHDRRYATTRDRRRAESLASSHVGSVPAGGEAAWDLPLIRRATGRGGAVTVVVLLSGGGERVLRHIHRLALRDADLGLASRRG
jgi:hypothetical protein